MSPGLYLVADDGTLIEMSEQRYDSEDVLQTLLESYPDLLAGDQFPGDEPRKWMLVKREAGIASQEGGGTRWSLDHLFLDQDGVPTLVEVKRSTNTEIRRQVVGQLLEYAANATAHWALDALQRDFDATCEKRGVAPEDEIAALLGAESDIESYWESVRANLRAGRVRLVFVSDEIPPELRRIVEFLNEQMPVTEVIALEVKQYVSETGQKTLAPRVIGQTGAARQAKRAYPRGEVWYEERFFAALDEQAPEEEARVIREVFEWARGKLSSFHWGRGAIYGTVTPMFEAHEQSYPTFTLWTSGSIQMRLGWLARHPPFDRPEMRQGLVDRLNAIPGVSVSPDAYEPGLPPSALLDCEARERFFAAIQWLVEEAMQ